MADIFRAICELAPIRAAAEAYKSVKDSCPLRMKKSLRMNCALYNKKRPGKPIVDFEMDNDNDVSLVDVLVIIAAVIAVMAALHAFSSALHALRYKRR
ncbi:MAG: hypothetical protein IJA85_06615 [Clostridia bacterium]|nr:hypothetical protein [Clostridia bacterium]MBQ4574857.1 hypothetical protein [Clostridia bacterium]